MNRRNIFVTGPDMIDVATSDGRGGSDDHKISVAIKTSAPASSTTPTLTIGSVGFDMATAFYLPYGGQFEQLVSASPTTIVVKVTTGDIYTFKGAFAFSGPFGSTAGTINSITDNNALGHLNYSFTNLALSFSTYLSYANVQNSQGFEEAVLGANGAVLGGPGNDYFIALTPAARFNGAGGTNTLDFSHSGDSRPVYINVGTGSATDTYFPSYVSPNVNYTDTFTNIQTIVGAAFTPTSFDPSYRNIFLGGPGNHTFIGNGSSELAYGETYDYPDALPTTGPVVFDFATDTAQNGFGGIDSFDSSFFDYRSEASSTTVIGGSGNHQLFINGSTVTLNYSDAPTAINATGTFGGSEYVENVSNGFGGTDSVGIFNNVSITNLTIRGSAHDDAFVDGFVNLNGGLDPVVSIDGGGGTNTMRFRDVLADYTITNSGGVVTVTETSSVFDQNLPVTLTNISLLKFSDQTVNIGATNQPPVTTAPASLTVKAGVVTAVSGISVADPDATSANETLTVALSDIKGLLSASTVVAGGGGTISGSGTTTLTISGTLAQVNADLTTLKDKATGPDMIDVATSDGRGGSDDHKISVAIKTGALASAFTPSDKTSISDLTLLCQQMASTFAAPDGGCVNSISLEPSLFSDRQAMVVSSRGM